MRRGDCASMLLAIFSIQLVSISGASRRIAPRRCRIWLATERPRFVLRSTVANKRTLSGVVRPAAESARAVGIVPGEDAKPAAVCIQQRDARPRAEVASRAIVVEQTSVRERCVPAPLIVRRPVLKAQCDPDPAVRLEAGRGREGELAAHERLPFLG